jgi:hypothetical protein
MHLAVDNSKSFRFEILKKMEDGKEYEFWFLMLHLHPLTEAMETLEQLVKEDVVRKRKFEVALPGYITDAKQTLTYYRLSPLYNIPLDIPKELRPLKIV